MGLNTDPSQYGYSWLSQLFQQLLQMKFKFVCSETVQKTEHYILVLLFSSHEAWTIAHTLYSLEDMDQLLEHVIIQSKLASFNLKSSDYTLQPCLELNLDHLLIEFKLPFLLIKSKLKHFITWAKTGVAQYFGPKLAWINISQLKLALLNILGQPGAFHDFESKLAPIILS